ncbi:MAG: mechanosensitive ion channel family protein [Candidatus Thorarchaeota archaeon]
MLQLNPLIDLLNNFLAFLAFWTPLLPQILFLILIWIALAITASVITKFLRKKALRGGIAPDAINGLILAIRLIFIWIGVVVFTAFLPPELMGWIVLIVGDASVIIGLAVGIAISAAMRNFIAGIYVMFADPFDVGDYVRIGSNEGIVLEVTMNYTKLRQIDGSITQIPNNSVMNSAVTNFKFVRKRKKKKLPDEQTTESTSMPQRMWKVISQVMDPSDLIQYTLELKFPIKQSAEKYTEILSKVCKRWENKFGFEPVFSMVSISHVAFTYAFTIFVENPQLLLEYRSTFIEDIGKVVY